MSENKNIKYAMMGGAALVGAAVLYYLTTSKVDETANAGENNDTAEKLDDDIEQIGEIEYEDGHVKFTQFLKIFEICSYHGKTNFAAEKKQLITRRR